MRDLTVYGLLDASDIVINTLLDTTYPVIVQAISPLISVVVVLYWAVFGMRIYTGYAPIDWMAVLHRIMMSVTLFSVLVWGSFAHHIFSFFIAFVDGMSSAMMTGKSTSAMLEELWLSVGSASAVLMGDQLLNIGITLQGFGLFILNCVLCIVIIAYMAIAKFGLALTMLLLPVFASFALFHITRQWAMNWIGMMLNFSLLYICVIAIVQVGFLMFENPVKKIVGEVKHAGMSDLDVAKITYIYLVEGVMFFFIMQARVWALTLSRYIHTQSVSLCQRLNHAGDPR